MKVFISWSGLQSQHIAHALREWLRRVIQHLDPWMSEFDIGAGQRWASELWKELQDSHFGVVCLTAQNLQAPWLHFEAGAVAKAVDQQVCPYLYELKPSDIKGPLSHFQMKQVNEKGTKELLQSINKVSSTLNEKVLPPEHLDDAFETWWPKLETSLNAVPPSTTGAPPRRDDRDMLEEILEGVRDLTRRYPHYTSDQFQLDIEKVRELLLKPADTLWGPQPEKRSIRAMLSILPPRMLLQHVRDEYPEQFNQYVERMRTEDTGKDPTPESP